MLVYCAVGDGRAKCTKDIRKDKRPCCFADRQSASFAIFGVRSLVGVRSWGQTIERGPGERRAPTHFDKIVHRDGETGEKIGRKNQRGRGREED